MHYTEVTYLDWLRLENGLCMCCAFSSLTDKVPTAETLWKQVDDAAEGARKGHTQSVPAMRLSLVAEALGVDRRRALSANEDKKRGLITYLSMVQGEPFSTTVRAAWRDPAKKGSYGTIIKLMRFPDRDTVTNALERILARPEYAAIYEGASDGV